MHETPSGSPRTAQDHSALDGMRGGRRRIIKGRRRYRLQSRLSLYSVRYGIPIQKCGKGQTPYLVRSTAGEGACTWIRRCGQCPNRYDDDEPLRPLCSYHLHRECAGCRRHILPPLDHWVKSFGFLPCICCGELSVYMDGSVSFGLSYWGSRPEESAAGPACGLRQSMGR